jgi:Fe-S cluster assembly protein SufD
MVRQIARGEPAAAERGFAEAYAALQERAGGQPDWLRALREQAFERFDADGLPDRRVEGWRWTDLRPLARTAFAAATPHDDPIAWDARTDPFDRLAGWSAVLVDGFLRRDLSRLDGLPDGVALVSLREAGAGVLDLGRPTVGPIDRLNAALLTDGIVLRIARDARPPRPIHIVHLHTERDAPTAFHARVALIAEPGADATVLESHIGLGAGAYLANPVTHVSVGAGAVLRHYIRQEEGPAAFHLAARHAVIERDARYESFLLAVGARLSRHEAEIRLAAPGAQLVLDGAYLMAGKQLFDATTIIAHDAPDGSSREVFKGVVDDEAKGVFQGRIAVAQDAQRIDAHQLHRALLLSQGAEVDTKPELEIFADDVKCSHGAAIGQIDADALFYLRARGIPQDEARALLVGAFVGEAIGTIAHEEVRAALDARVAAWLAARGKGNAI